MPDQSGLPSPSAPPVPANVDYNYSGLPESLRGGVRHWLEAGIQPGGFLSAVIANNLSESLGRADHNNMSEIFRITAWFYNHCPSGAWGSPDNAREWAKAHGREFKWMAGE